jgi:hypothetical protein
VAASRVGGTLDLAALHRPRALEQLGRRPADRPPRLTA